MKIIKILISFLLLLAVFGLPYAFYIFLRIIVFTSMIFFIFTEYKTIDKWITFIYVILAVLFNPIIPVYLTKEIWFYIDILSAISILIIVIVSWKQKKY